MKKFMEVAMVILSIFSSLGIRDSFPLVSTQTYLTAQLILERQQGDVLQEMYNLINSFAIGEGPISEATIETLKESGEPAIFVLTQALIDPSVRIRIAARTILKKIMERELNIQINLETATESAGEVPLVPDSEREEEVFAEMVRESAGEISLEMAGDIEETFGGIATRWGAGEIPSVMGEEETNTTGIEIDLAMSIEIDPEIEQEPERELYVIPALIKAFSHSNPEIRFQTIKIFKNFITSHEFYEKEWIVASARPALINALADEHELVRSLAKSTLIATLDAFAVQECMNALASENAFISSAAIEIVAIMGRKAISALIEALANPNPLIWSRAVETLTRMGGYSDNRYLIQDLKKKLAQVLFHEDPFVSFGALWVLKNMGISLRPEIHAFLGRLAHADQAQLVRAAVILGNIRPSPLPLLIGELENPDPVLHDTLSTILEHIDGARIEASVVVQFLAHMHPQVRLGARKILIRMGKSAVPVLIEALTNKRGEVRIHACEILGQIGVPAISELMKALASNNACVRGGAATALTMIGAPAVPVLLEALAQLPHSDAFNEGLVRLKIARVLIRTGISTISHSIHALESPDSLVRRDAIKVLEKIGTAAASVLFLLKHAAETEEGLSFAVEKALEPLGYLNGAVRTSLIKAAASFTFSMKLREQQSPTKLCFKEAITYWGYKIMQAMGLWSVSEVTENVYDSNPAVSIPAAKRIGEYGICAASALPVLMTRLENDPRWEVEVAMAQALVALRENGMPIDITYADSPLYAFEKFMRRDSTILSKESLQTYLQAVESMSFISTVATFTVPALEKATSDRNLLVRQAAETALYRIEQAASQGVELKIKAEDLSMREFKAQLDRIAKAV